MRAYGGSHPHRIVPHGPDRMVLACSRSGQGVIEAKRSEGSRTWTLIAHNSDAEDQVVETDDTRAAAIDAMIAFAFQTLPHEGIEVYVPSRQLSEDLAATPHYLPRHHRETLADGTEVPVIHLRDEP